MLITLVVVVFLVTLARISSFFLQRNQLGHVKPSIRCISTDDDIDEDDESPCFLVQGYLEDTHDPWRTENDLYHKPISSHPTAAELENNAYAYLKCNLPVHAIGEANRAQTFSATNNVLMTSRLHRIKAESYLKMEAPEPAFREIYQSVMAVRPLEQRNIVVKHLWPVWSEIFTSDTTALQVDDGVFVKTKYDELIEFVAEDLPDSLFYQNLGGVALSLKSAAAIMIETLSAIQEADLDGQEWNDDTKNTLPSKVMVPHRYRLAEGEGRHITTLTADTKLTIQAAGGVKDDTFTISSSGPGQYCLSATRDIKKEEVIFIEPPIVSIWSDIDNQNGCSHCWRPFSPNVDSSKEVSCSSCGEKYCSQTCYDQSNSEYHQVLCGNEWRNFMREVSLETKQGALPATFCLAIKVTAMGVQQGMHPLHLPRFRTLIRQSDSPMPINSGSDKDKICKSIFTPQSELFLSQFAVMCPQLVQKGIGHVGHVFEAADTIQSSSVAGISGKGIAYSALYHLTSLMNHDCEPNAAIIIDHAELGNKAAIIAERDIKQGEDITISYIDQQSIVQERQALLETIYGFTCRCARCRREEAK